MLIIDISTNIFYEEKSENGLLLLNDLKNKNKIPLYDNNGNICDSVFVDPDKYEEINKGRWNKSPKGYAIGNINNFHGFMHRYVLNLKKVILMFTIKIATD